MLCRVFAEALEDAQKAERLAIDNSDRRRVTWPRSFGTSARIGETAAQRTHRHSMAHSMSELYLEWQ